MAQEQEVKKTQKKKSELQFEPGKVFGPGAEFELGVIPDPKSKQSLEAITREAERNKQIDEASWIYRAKKGEGGDRSRVYGIL